MKYFGIDIGKRFHVACCIDDANTISKHIKFNSLFISKEAAPDDITIGLEATGH